MKTVELIYISVVLGLTLFFITPASAANKTRVDQKQPFKPLSFVDGAGRRIELNRPIKRIFSGSPDISEIIRILGAEEKVVGVDMFTAKQSHLFPEMSKLPMVGEHGNVNLEKVVELRPDIYLANTSITWYPVFQSIVNSLEPETKVICLNFIDLNTFTNDFEILSKILSRELAGSEFLKFHNRILNRIEQKTKLLKSAGKPRAYFEMYQSWRTFSKKASMYQIQIDLAGGKNIAEAVDGVMFEVDKEWMVGADPEIIIKVAYPNAGYPDVPKTDCGYLVSDPSGIMRLVESIKSREILSSTKAVSSDRVYAQHYHLVDSPRNFIGVAYLAKWFHPGVFHDLDPEAIHREYISRFLKLRADLVQNGVFNYPD